MCKSPRDIVLCLCTYRFWYTCCILALYITVRAARTFCSPFFPCFRGLCFLPSFWPPSHFGREWEITSGTLRGFFCAFLSIFQLSPLVYLRPGLIILPTFFLWGIFPTESWQLYRKGASAICLCRFYRAANLFDIPLPNETVIRGSSFFQRWRNACLCDYTLPPGIR